MSAWPGRSLEDPQRSWTIGEADPDVSAARASSRALAATPVAIGLAVTALLLAVSGRYGYHRDEFYYVAAGRRPAWGYLDNPPLVPWLARAETALLGESATALRVVPAIAVGLTVVLTGLIARELGGGRVAAAVAAGAAAGSAFLVATGHMLSTSTIDVLVWAALGWLVIRALRDGGRVWLAVGTVAGVGLLTKALVAAYLGTLLIGVLACGPRAALRDRWLWLGVLLAAALWAPHLGWQSLHGWPQLTFGDHIATVGNGGSEPRWTFPLYQLVDVSPLLVPVWVAGLWALARDPAMRWVRAFAVSYGLLFAMLLVAGGKHYYLAGTYAVLLGAGAVVLERWIHRGRVRGRIVTGVLAVNAALIAWLMLPLIPVTSLPGSPQASVSPLPPETVGWPELVSTVAAARDALPAAERGRTVVLASNYGEAGAVELLGDAPVHSGHNSYADWGPPPETATTVVAVGYDEATLRRWFASVRVVARIENAAGVQNDERGQPVAVATGRLAPWTALWPGIRRLA